MVKAGECKVLAVFLSVLLRPETPPGVFFIIIIDLEWGSVPGLDPCPKTSCSWYDYSVIRITLYFPVKRIRQYFLDISETEVSKRSGTVNRVKHSWSH